MKNVTKDIFYVGVNDHQIDLFESQYDVPNGMAYNSYLIKDEKVLVTDAVDIHFYSEWLNNVNEVLGDRKPYYLLVHHMEPDHSGSLVEFLKVYPDVTVVSSMQAFKMFNQFFPGFEIKNKLVVKEGDSLNLGKHELTFITANMVHWPEVIMSYDKLDKVLFSADAFGKFGALDVEEDWACEARRYYFGIVGKYGMQVQNVLAKASKLDIEIICALHGPILKENLGYYLGLYNTWSRYEVETEGVAIFYTSVYGHTREAAELLKEELIKEACPKVVLNDLAREDMAECVEDAFRYGRIVLATTTYNMSIFPFMNEFLTELIERNYQNKKIAIIENGTWAPNASKVIKEKIQNLKNIELLQPEIRILSALSEQNKLDIKVLAKELLK